MKAAWWCCISFWSTSYRLFE